MRDFALVSVFIMISSFVPVPAIAHEYLTDKPMEDAPALTIASYNIMASRLSRTDNVAKAVVALGADIVGLQEVDDKTQRSAKNAGSEMVVDQAAFIAEAAKMYHAFCEAIGFEGGHYGVALLSKWPIEKTVVEKLPNVGEREQRVVCANYIKVPGFSVPLAAIVTHPDPEFDPELRRAQVRAVMGFINKINDAVPVLVTDMNLVPASPEYSEIKYLMNDTLPVEGSYTFPSWNPNRRIDYVMTSKAQMWDIKEAFVPKPASNWNGIDWSQASDHLPVVVKMQLLEQ